MVTLTGPGGIGKTRLALELARLMDGELTGGAWFVPLEAITDVDLVLPTIAEAVGAPADAGAATRRR